MYRHQRYAHWSLWSLSHTTRAFNHETTCAYTAPTQPSWNLSWASKLMLRSWPKAMSTVASGHPRSLQDEGVDMTVVGLGQEAS